MKIKRETLERAVSSLINEVDYDIWKESYWPERDPESQDNIDHMVGLLANILSVDIED